MRHLDERAFSDLLLALERGERIPTNLATEDRADLALAARLVGLRADRPAPATPPWALAAAVGVAPSIPEQFRRHSRPHTKTLALPPRDIRSLRDTIGGIRARRGGGSSADRGTRRRPSAAEAIAVALLGLVAVALAAQRGASDRARIAPPIRAETVLPPSAAPPGVFVASPTPRHRGRARVMPSASAESGRARATTLAPLAVPPTAVASAAAPASATPPVPESGEFRPAATRPRSGEAAVPALTPPPYPPPWTEAPATETTVTALTSTPPAPSPSGEPTTRPAYTRPPSSTPFVPTATSPPPPQRTPTPATPSTWQCR